MATRSSRVRACRECGCTESTACQVGELGCCWIERDLCSACATLPQILASYGGCQYLIAVLRSLHDRGCVEGRVIRRAELEVDVYAQ